MAKFEITWLEDRSDEAVLSEIRRVAALIPDDRLTKRAFNSQSKIKSSAVERRFGSWSEATRRAGLPDALPDYSDASIIGDLKRVATSFPNEPLTSVFYEAHGRYSPSCVKRRFRGWREALDAADIGSRFVGPQTTERMLSQPGRAMSDEEILDRIRDVSKRLAPLGKSAIAGADIEANSEISQSMMYRRFGSVSAALRKAGVEQASLGRRYTEDEVFENLLKVWTRYGRPPTAVEMDNPPSAVGQHTYIKRYGGWRKALKAFVERANSEADGDPEVNHEQAPMRSAEHLNLAESPTTGTPSKGNTSPASQIGARPPVTRHTQTNVRPEDRREPGIGVRFKVLQRDNFRCLGCGRSPATELGCILHVDHIVPFSKGGKTTFDNLQTLCSHCNVGKSNRSV
jgi:5-methylcytosine-specific restriction endonuclease McrA